MAWTKEKHMTEEEFCLLRDLINKEFGIQIKGDKRLTIHTKVSHRLNILGLDSYTDYYKFIIEDQTKGELFALASHITNNETYFFREKTQLDVFSELLKEAKKERQKKNQNTLKILSVACSSGEEPYSLNIIVQESGLFVWNWNVMITGIDIDKNAIRKAYEASYGKNSFRLQNGNGALINKYFIKNGERYALRKFFTRNVEFRHGNLLHNDSFNGLNSVDFIFCRNVLIYMNDDAVNAIVGNLYNCLSDDGYLFIGSTESLIQKTDLFVPEYNRGIIVYRKNV